MENNKVIEKMKIEKIKEDFLIGIAISPNDLVMSEEAIMRIPYAMNSTTASKKPTAPKGERKKG